MNVIPNEVLAAARRDPFIKLRRKDEPLRTPILIDEHVVGFCHPHDTPSGFRLGPIFVLPQYRGQGAMRRAYEEHALGKKCVAFIHAGNVASERAHQAAGFVLSSTRKTGTVWRCESRPQQNICDLVQALAAAIKKLPMSERIAALNDSRQALHAVSPFSEEPVDLVLWIPAERVRANDYNPNAVAPPEMMALTHSVRRYGFTTPIVTAPGDAPGEMEINDGFHRNRVGREDAGIASRLHGYLPVAILKGEMSRADRMSATVLHNKARGEHSVIKEIDIVREMGAAGWDDEKIAVGLVKSDEELIRLRQTGGVAKRLANVKYDKAWKW